MTKKADESKLYGDTPIFTYTPKDGGDPIIFPAHSTIREGEVEGKTYFEMLWEFDEFDMPYSKQVFAFLKRSGATLEMRRRVARLPEDEIGSFLSAWIQHDDQPLPSPPPES